MFIACTRPLPTIAIAAGLLLGLGAAGCSWQSLPGWHEVWGPALSMFPAGSPTAEPPQPIGSDRVLEALKSPDPKVRAAAVAAWADRQSEMPPAAVADLVRDPNPRVSASPPWEPSRRRRPANAESLLVGAVEDHDIQVRVAAIAALGELGRGPSHGRLGATARPTAAS